MSSRRPVLLLHSAEVLGDFSRIKVRAVQRPDLSARSQTDQLVDDAGSASRVEATVGQDKLRRTQLPFGASGQVFVEGDARTLAIVVGLQRLSALTIPAAARYDLGGEHGSETPRALDQFVTPLPKTAPRELDASGTGAAADRPVDDPGRFSLCHLCDRDFVVAPNRDRDRARPAFAFGGSPRLPVPVGRWPLPEQRGMLQSFCDLSTTEVRKVKAGGSRQSMAGKVGP